MMEKVDEQLPSKAGTEKSEPKYRRYTVGRKTTARDQLLKRSLYTALTLTTEQIAKMYFPSQDYINDSKTTEQAYSEGSAKQRLYKLRREGILQVDFYTPIGEDREVGYWYLSQKQYKRQAKAADRPGERYPDIPERLTHHFKVTEIYARIQPRFEELFSTLDGYDYPEWRWENESHASRDYQFKGKHRKHQPDAMIHMPDGGVFILERQTKEAKQPPEVVKEKVQRANDYAEYCGYSEAGAKLLFACDTDRDKKYARDALQELWDNAKQNSQGSKEEPIRGMLGGPNTIVKSLLSSAEELVQGSEKAL